MSKRSGIGKPAKKLVIKELLSGGDVQSTNFSLLNLEASSWSFERGARTERKYKDVNDEVAVIDNYRYNYIDDGRSIDSYTRHIDWYNTDGTVGESKDVTPLLNKKKIKEINRAFRQGQIDYLEASAEEYRDVADQVPEPYKTQYNQIATSIDVLFSHYSAPIFEYVTRGTRNFENLVLTEEIPSILQILQIPTAPSSPKFPNGLVVKTSILYQLRGYLETPGDSDG